MKRFYWIFPLIGLLFFALNVHSQEIPTFIVNVGEVQGYSLNYDPKTLNVRSGPARQYSVRGVVFDGDRLTVTGRNDFDAARDCDGGYYGNPDMWLRVDFQGIEGWVAYCLGSFEGDLNIIPVVEPAHAVPSWGNYIYKSRGRTDELGASPDENYIIARTRFARTHVYSVPDLDSSLVDVASTEEVYVVGRSADGVWLEVTYTGHTSFRNYRWGDSPQVIRGWMVRSTLHVIMGWDEDSIPIIE